MRPRGVEESHEYSSQVDVTEFRPYDLEVISELMDGVP